MRRIDMDANATTPLLPEVFEAMRPFFLEHFGNPSSIHQRGQFARAAVDHARDSVARLLHCRASEIVFTSGGTESDNLALFGAFPSTPPEPNAPPNPRPHLITTAAEHHAVLHAAEALARRGDVDVTFLPVLPSGLLDPATLAAALRPETRLVSILLANNETGVLQPIADLARIVKAHNPLTLVHTDAVQAAAKLPLDLSPPGPLHEIDLLTLSGHKIYGPQGTGVLFVRRSVRLSPQLHGGPHERQRRAGTENLPALVGLGRAADLALPWLQDAAPASLPPEATLASTSTPLSTNPTASTGTAGTTGPIQLAHLRDRLEQTLLAQIPESGINGEGAPRVVNTTNLWFDHVEAEALVIALDLKGLFISGGSACQSGATEPSHVLTSMGLSPARARASIRLSLSRLSTPADIEAALDIIPTAVRRLRDLSPTWKNSTHHPAA